MAPDLAAVVVDNASSDGTLSLLRMRAGIQVIANDRNRGFAAAVNQGIRATTAEHLLLLNPDARLRTPLAALIDACGRYGLAAGKLTGDDGLPQTGFSIRRFPTPASLIFELLGINRLWPSNPVNRRYRYLDRDLDESGFVEQPAGAFLMVRRDVWQELGGLDEAFHPVWFEDVDFCRAATGAGYQIAYVPQVTAAHTGGHSIGSLTKRCRALYWCVSLLRYAAKRFRPLAYRGVCAAAMLSSVPRAVSGMILDRSLEPVVTYFKIFCFAGRRLVSSRLTLTSGGRDF